MAGRPSWWLAHLFLDDGWSDHEDLDEPAATAEFPLPAGARLLLTVTSFSSELAFAVAGEDPVSVAWDDQAHWHPALLRWDELEAVVAHATAGVPWSAWPDVATALLHRFAAIAADDELERAARMVGPALRRLGLNDEQSAAALAGIDWRPGTTPRGLPPEDDDVLVGPGWVRDDAVGWRLEVHWRNELAREGRAALPAAYSLRRPENEDFPRALAAVLDELVDGPSHTHSA